MATVGLDVGGTKILGVAIVGGEVVAEDRRASARTGEELLDDMAALVALLGEEAGDPVTAVGVGLPGLVDRQGSLRFAPNLAGASGLQVRAGLEARVGVPVAVDNDATCAAWGERQLGAARGLDDVVLVTLGTGIGGGIISGGRLQRGAQGFAAEIGHMVVDPMGPACACGRTGCWERFASGFGLGRLAREAAQAGRADAILTRAGIGPEDLRGEHVTAAVAAGDPEAIEIMAGFASWVALGLANLANIFDPEAFVIGGGLVACGDALLGPARVAFADQVEGGPARPPIALLAAELGVRAGAIGAALLEP